MNESDAFFRDTGKVHETLREITRRLTELGIPHAVVGGMALYRHGFRRSTEDVDLLVTPESLKRIHAELEGRGYLPPFARSKNLRDTQTGVKIEFLKTGDFPGDGKPKPFAFPDPADVVEVRDGIPVVRLTTLIELKIASGISSPDRLKDLADAQELIKILSLSASFVNQLHPSVRDKFSELWQIAHPKTKRYKMIWRNKFLTVHTKSFDEMIESLSEAVETLKAMKADGRLLIIEMVLPPGDTPHLGKIMDMVMLVIPGGQERTEAEYGALLGKAGFRLVGVVPTESAVSLVEAIPA